MCVCGWMSKTELLNCKAEVCYWLATTSMSWLHVVLTAGLHKSCMPFIKTHEKEPPVRGANYALCFCTQTVLALGDPRSDTRKKILAGGKILEVGNYPGDQVRGWRQMLVMPKTCSCEQQHTRNQPNFLPNLSGPAVISLWVQGVKISIKLRGACESKAVK